MKFVINYHTYNLYFFFWNKLQVSYLIVDQAEEDCEVVQDPFLEAGITIPSDLPYQDKSVEKGDQKDSIELKIQLDGDKVEVWIYNPIYWLYCCLIRLFYYFFCGTALLLLVYLQLDIDSAGWRKSLHKKVS